MKKNPIAVGLFSNVRGIEIGAQRAGFYTPFSTDIEEDVRIHFMANQEKANQKPKETFYTCDILYLTFNIIREQLNQINVSIDVGDIDCLVGGPPCFGMTTLSSKRSVFNPLNMLMLEMLRIANEAQPKTIFIEQVPPFLTKQLQPFRQLVYHEMDKMRNYTWEVKALYAENFGAYQSRERVVILGVRKDLDVPASLPEPMPVDLSRQSAFATIGAELFTSGQFNHPPSDGKKKVFGTMTGGDSEKIFINDRWRKLTIEERKILTDMTDVDFSTLTLARQRKTMGNMVMPQFAEAIMRHIYHEILLKSSLYTNCDVNIDIAA